MRRREILSVAAAVGSPLLISTRWSEPAWADEGGLSFWLLGTFGGLSATCVLLLFAISLNILKYMAAPTPAMFAQNLLVAAAQVRKRTDRCQKSAPI